MNPSNRSRNDEVDPLLARERRTTDIEAGGHGQPTGTYNMDNHPAVTALYSRAGLLDVIAVVLLMLIGVHEHRRVAFKHDIIDYKDPAISYPYHPHVRYPEWPWLPIIALVVPAAVLLGLRLISLIFYSILTIPMIRRRFPQVTQMAFGQSTLLLRQSDIRLLLTEIGKWMYIDGFAILATASLTYAVAETLKTWCGGLRPDFLSRCDWDKDSGKCTGSESLIDAGRKSFPSGHAAYSFSAMTLLTRVLFHKMAAIRRSFWKALLCLLPLFWAARFSLTRWWENRHSAVDLSAGALTGVIIALVCFHIFYHQRSCVSS